MQLAALEVARNLIGLKDGHSVEVNAETPDPIVTLLSDQSNSERFGGTLKLGTFESTLVNNTKTKAAYNNIESVNERHRHRYGINQAYKNQLEEAGLIVSAYEIGRAHV